MWLHSTPKVESWAARTLYVQKRKWIEDGSAANGGLDLCLYPGLRHLRRVPPLAALHSH